MENKVYNVYKATPKNAYSGGMVLFSAENDTQAKEVLKKIEDELDDYYWGLVLGNITQIEGITYGVGGKLIEYDIYME